MFQKYSFLRKRLKASGLSLLIIGMALSLLSACGSTKAENPAEPSQTAAAVEESQAPEASEAPEASVEVSATKTVTDEQGHELVIPAKPLKVFAPYMEDSLLSLGVTPIAQWGNSGKGQAYLQDRLKGVPTVEFSGGRPPSPEQIMDFEPDLIILHTAHYADDGIYEQYSKIAPTYVFVNAAGDLNSSITKLGELLGKPAEAKQALGDYEQKKEEAKAKLAPVADGKKAVLINFNAKGMYLIGGNYFGGYVLSHELGIGKSKLVEEKNSVDASLEILPELDADFIFTIDYAGSGAANIKELTDNAIWRSMPAVKAGHVYAVSDEYWTGGGLIAYSKIIDDIVRFLAP
ncbi:ferrichrome ABC transporter substrate-binding protein [Paenibacillus sp. BIHB 4019]|uniref:Ferrichrome ABC transporter substrate-binding protein n=1 Tax=Paenibacillus sp. BIHB 4019 TaxID=1870819 RepID=A0A1B2DE58_9BACL|nr:ABC transporter substrate-binding protein [Paenibacillus sp. BIHB 4019]ANY65983.1 ferrichrome ABC transporter substrate-binding protein [Paenibacillus sp. BIHB 4019]